MEKGAVDMPPGEDSSITFKMYLGLPDGKSLPDNHYMVSGLLKIQPEHDFLLQEGKIATVELQHCEDISSEEDRQSINAVVARGEGPLEIADKSQEDVKSSSFLVRLKELTTLYLGVVSVMVWRRSAKYCGIVYRLQKEASITSQRFHFIVVKDLGPCITVSVCASRVSCLPHAKLSCVVKGGGRKVITVYIANFAGIRKHEKTCYVKSPQF